MNAMLPLALLLVSALLFAAISRRVEMSMVTMPLVFTAAGYVSYLAGGELLPSESEYETLHLLAEVTLIIILFSDASQIRLKDLKNGFGVPARMLAIGMPLTIALGTAVVFWFQPDQPWTLALLLAAILTPTDAALGQAVVTSEEIPHELREAVAVESGLNDGLALPVVIIAALFAAEATGSMADFTAQSLAQFTASQVLLGPLAGIVVGFTAAKLLDWADRRDLATASYKGIFFLSCAFLCFLAAELVGGNGLIAAFIGGLTFGNARTEACAFVQEFMESEGQLLTMATFVIFGAVLVPEGLAHISWATVAIALAFLTVIRMAPIVLSLTGTGVRFRDKLFLGWFGPRGLASILFALLILEEHDLPGSDEMLACVALTVMISIAVHGASAFPIVKAFTRRGAD